ncbi:hypothetical protein DYL61_26555 [Pseudomonas nabeulensis]|uniref:Fimbrial protein n=1 Tax=Pseudomonas nabeulensis TaxID=2293833 RepID=A0A4Z0AMQ7_9PSED|nr:hypothetical protein [Pseudomonas nabeulensis]TFY87238.1 hypothetical protein DYL61_26555 [Pseudomonas nabeulensis]
MGARHKSMGVVLFCTVLMAQGVRAENCRVSVSQPHVDYGVIRRPALVERPSVALGTRTVQLNVTCVEASPMALRFIGVPDGQGFRLGRQGRFHLRLSRAQVDGRTVEWEAAQLPGEAVTGQLLPGQTLVARAAGEPVAGQRMVAQVEIDVDLPSYALQVPNETRLEGRGSFELVTPAVPRSR